MATPKKTKKDESKTEPQEINMAAIYRAVDKASEQKWYAVVNDIISLATHIGQAKTMFINACIDFLEAKDDLVDAVKIAISNDDEAKDTQARTLVDDTIVRGLNHYMAEMKQ